MSRNDQVRGLSRIWPWWLSGLLAGLLIGAFTILPLAAMMLAAGNIDWKSLYNTSYIRRVITFSVYQAALSTGLSLLCALPLALALAHKPRFPGRTLVINMLSLSLVVPTIIAIFGVVAVFGRTGWVNSALASLSLPAFSIYGLSGILICHVFFNMPLAARVLLINLQGIPEENWRLATQLGMRPWSVFRFIEWPSIRSQIPSLALLIFTLCFTSFAIVMTLGGGPRATTIEVAIYQALRFDFDIDLAVALASVQLTLCAILMVLSTLVRHNRDLNFTAHTTPATHSQEALKRSLTGSLWKGKPWDIANMGTIAVAGSFILLPLLALASSSFNRKFVDVLTDSATLDALVNTLWVATLSALLSLGLALSLLITTRHLRVRRRQEHAGQWLQLSGNVILVLPPLVLGTGLFLLLRPYADVFSIALVLVIILNSLMALPFVLRVLDGPVLKSAEQYDRLLQSLNIQGWNRWRWIDWPLLRKPIAFSLALSATLSAGDLSAIALFGSERVRTLPLLLYQRMGSYRLEEAAATAGILMLLCLLIFSTVQWMLGGKRNAGA